VYIKIVPQNAYDEDRKGRWERNVRKLVQGYFGCWVERKQIKMLPRHLSLSLLSFSLSLLFYLPVSIFFRLTLCLNIYCLVFSIFLTPLFCLYYPTFIFPLVSFYFLCMFIFFNVYIFCLHTLLCVTISFSCFYFFWSVCFVFEIENSLHVRWKGCTQATNIGSCKTRRLSELSFSFSKNANLDFRKAFLFQGIWLSLKYSYIYFKRNLI